MLKTYRYPEFPYLQSAEQQAGSVKRHPVVIAGAGPIGLTAALDCAQRGIPAVVLEDNNTVSIGSRAVCYAKRPPEVWDRLGVGERMVDKGVGWKVGTLRQLSDACLEHLPMVPRQQIPQVWSIERPAAPARFDMAVRAPVRPSRRL